LLLCMSLKCAAVTPATALSFAIQILPQAGSLDLSSPDKTAPLREASTPVRITATGARGGASRPIEVYAYLFSEEAMKRAGKASALATATLRIRNDHGEWSELKPLAELDGHPGVRIAVLNSASATILLQVQLQVPASQAPGSYEGVVTLEAQEK
jgi:hypothetical protein